MEYPNGVYIALKPTKETKEKLKDYINKYLKDFNTLDIEKTHCTIIYSKKEHRNKVEAENYTISAKSKGFDFFGSMKNILSIMIESKELNQRYVKLRNEHNFISNYSRYTPHISLVLEAKDIDIKTLPDIDFELVFENEFVEDLDSNYRYIKKDLFLDSFNLKSEV